MAVHGRRNDGGPMNDNDMDDENALFFDGDDLLDDDQSDTPPHLRELASAVQLGDVEALRNALDTLEGNIDEPVEDGDTALHLACLYGYAPCAQLLLERGASMETRDEDGAIPLHDACAGGFVDVVELLINTANSADSLKRMLEAVEAEGDTPLHHAARGEHADVVKLLLASGASPTKPNSYGKVPSELADPDTEAKRILEAAASSAVAA